MSKVAIVGDPSGTGTFTISAPNGNTDRTLVLPDEAGTVLTSATPVVLPKGGPAFLAHESARQTISGGTETVCVLDVKKFDTNGCFNNTASTQILNGISVPAYAFAPNVAGYYQVNAQIRLETFSQLNYHYTVLRLNGVRYKRMSEFYTATIGNMQPVELTNTILIYLNGTSDYIQLAVEENGSGTLQVGYQIFDYSNHFSAHLVRAA